VPYVEAKCRVPENAELHAVILADPRRLSLSQLFDSAFPGCPLSRLFTNTETRKDIHDSSLRV
jgi:hypothetical protein